MLVNWRWRQCVKGRSLVDLSTKTHNHHNGHYIVFEISTKWQLIVRLAQLLLYWTVSPTVKGDKKSVSGWNVVMKERTFFPCLLSVVRWVSYLFCYPIVQCIGEAVIDLSRIEHKILYSPGVTYLEVIENGPTFHTSVCFSQKDGFCNTDSTFKEVNEWVFCRISVAVLLNTFILWCLSSG